MFKLNKPELFGLAAVLIALLAATGGLVISQAAGGRAVQRQEVQRQRPWTLDRRSGLGDKE